VIRPAGQSASFSAGHHSVARVFSWMYGVEAPAERRAWKRPRFQQG